MKIGAFIDENHKIQSFVKGKYLAVFIKEKNKWKIEKLIELINCETFGIAEMRSYFNSITDLIPDTNVIVAKEAYGVPYNVFCSKNFSIWEMEGDPHEFLDQVMMKEIHNEEMDLEEVKVEPIIEIAKGKYFIDLIELQNTNGISSKQVMMPLLQNKIYDTLEIKCCHVPLWLNKERSKLGFSMEVQEQGRDIYKVILNNLD